MVELEVSEESEEEERDQRRAPQEARDLVPEAPGAFAARAPVAKRLQLPEVLARGDLVTSDDLLVLLHDAVVLVHSVPRLGPQRLRGGSLVPEVGLEDGRGQLLKRLRGLGPAGERGLSFRPRVVADQGQVVEHGPGRGQADSVPLHAHDRRIGLRARDVPLGEEPGPVHPVREAERHGHDPAPLGAGEQAHRFVREPEGAEPVGPSALGVHLDPERVERGLHALLDALVHREHRRDAAHGQGLLLAQELPVFQEIELERRDQIPLRGIALAERHDLEAGLAREEKAGEEKEAHEKRGPPEAARRAPEPPEPAGGDAASRLQHPEGLNAHYCCPASSRSPSRARRTRG